MRSKKFLIFLFCLIILVIIVVKLILLSEEHKPTVRPNSGVVISVNKMSSIGFAILHYCSSKKHFPFSDECDLVSWRALILPILENDEYDKLVKMGYSPDKSWKSNENAKAREYFIVPYCLSFVNRKNKNTVIVAIRSERGIFYNNNEISLENSTDFDYLDNTLMLIEVADSGINWLEPRDITEKDLGTIRGLHKVDGQDCIVIGMANGRGYVLTLENFRQIYPTLITIDHNKKIIKEQNGSITTMKIAQ
ncbi:MAG: DUF1559 domain-containing protein [Planctomycetaceae bacterium]|jgi:hypothetical protein|nr:DUF1559 domain-containing protein [Planctomycetaceae bacterium]